MPNAFTTVRILCLSAALLLLTGSTVQARGPVPRPETPTLNGATPMVGKSVSGEVGYSALRGTVLIGLGADRDVGFQLSAPTYGNIENNGLQQETGVDLHVPFRFRLWRLGQKAQGGLRVAPFLHVGRVCSNWAGRGRGRGRACNDPLWGMGGNFGFLTDIAARRWFKVIVGLDTRWQFWRDGEANFQAFRGAAFAVIGLESYWEPRRFFFSWVMNAGAQYGSNEFWYDGRDDTDAVFQWLFGFGYKFQ